MNNIHQNGTWTITQETSMARQRPVDGLRLESVSTQHRSVGISMIVERQNMLEMLGQKLNGTHVKRHLVLKMTWCSIGWQTTHPEWNNVEMEETVLGKIAGTSIKNIYRLLFHEKKKKEMNGLIMNLIVRIRIFPKSKKQQNPIPKSKKKCNPESKPRSIKDN